MKDNWRNEKLGNLVSFQKGKISEQSDYPRTDFLPIINTETIGGKISVWANPKGSVVCKPNDVLMLWDGERSGLVATGFEGVVGSTFSRLRVDELDKQFLFYFLKEKFIWIQNQRTGTGVPHVPKDLKNILFVKYPSEIRCQRKIANILETADAVIEKTEATIAKYLAVKQGMMQDLFTRGIDPQTGKLRPGQKDAPQLYKETVLGWIPKEWEMENLQQLTNKIIDGTHHTPTYTETGIPFLRVTDVQTKEINFDRIKFVSPFEHKNLIKRCKPEKGDILYSKNGTIGIPKIVDWEWEFSVFVSLALIKPNHNKINNQFLASLLEEEVIWKQIRKRAKQGTVTNLHLEEIREFLIPLPNMKEQKEIAKRYLSIQGQIENEQSNLSKHQSLKKGLMQDLLTGKVEVEV